MGGVKVSRLVITCGLAWCASSGPAEASSIPKLEPKQGTLTLSLGLGAVMSYGFMPIAVVSSDFAPTDSLSFGAWLTTVPYQARPWSLGMTRLTARLGDFFDGLVSYGLSLSAGEGWATNSSSETRAFFVQPSGAITIGQPTDWLAFRALLGPRFGLQFYEVYRVTNTQGMVKEIEFLYPDSFWGSGPQAYFSTGDVTGSVVGGGWRMNSVALASSFELALRATQSHEIALSTDGTIGWRGSF